MSERIEYPVIAIVSCTCGEKFEYRLGLRHRCKCGREYVATPAQVG